MERASSCSRFLASSSVRGYLATTSGGRSSREAAEESTAACCCVRYRNSLTKRTCCCCRWNQKTASSQRVRTKPQNPSNEKYHSKGSNSHPPVCRTALRAAAAPPVRDNREREMVTIAAAGGAASAGLMGREARGSRRKGGSCSAGKVVMVLFLYGSVGSVLLAFWRLNWQQLQRQQQRTPAGAASTTSASSKTTTATSAISASLLSFLDTTTIDTAVAAAKSAITQRAAAASSSSSSKAKKKFHIVFSTGCNAFQDCTLLRCMSMISFSFTPIFLWKPYQMKISTVSSPLLSNIR
jgi:hypothetical protein